MELETEKIDLEVNAEKSGVLASIKRREGRTSRSANCSPSSTESAAAAKAAERLAPQPVRHCDRCDDCNRSAEEPRATPTARRIAKEHDLNLGGVQGSGALGTVDKADVRTPRNPHRPGQPNCTDSRVGGRTDKPVRHRTDNPSASHRRATADCTDNPVAIAPTSAKGTHPHRRRPVVQQESLRRSLAACRSVDRPSPAAVESQRTAAMLTTLTKSI